MTPRSFLFFVLAAALAPPGCAASGGPGIDLESCRVPGEGKALCGTLRVPENRAAPDGRSIDLNIVVLPARSARPAPDPIFFLHGGPGGAATVLTPVFARSELREERDIVLVDQRGTGGSNPMECDESDLQTLLRELEFELADVAECRAALDADPRFYTTSIAVEDLEAVRRALGAERVNLYGGSYGTRVALDYLRRHPQAVRAVVLRGVAPPPFSIPSAIDHDSLRALGSVLDDCAADRACAKAFPRLRQELDEVLERLEREPATARILDPFEGDTVSVPVSRQLFVTSLHYGLYMDAGAASVPAFIHRASAGNYDEPIDRVVKFSVALAPHLSAGAFLSVACAEDAPFYDADEVVREARDTLLRGVFSKNLARVCETWDVPPVPAEFKNHVRSDAPVLLISGDADPVTPPRWADEALRHLPNGKHIVLPRTGHSGLAPGCVGGLVLRFFETASTAELDIECASRAGRGPFKLD